MEKNWVDIFYRLLLAKGSHSFANLGVFKNGMTTAVAAGMDYRVTMCVMPFFLTNQLKVHFCQISMTVCT